MAPTEAPPRGPDAPDGDKPWWRKWWGIAVIVLGVIILIGALTDGGDDAPDEATTAAEEPDAAAEEEAEPTEELEETPDPEEPEEVQEEIEEEADPEPVEVEEPEPEPEPIEPVVYEGSGDDVIDVETFELPMVATIEHQGSSNFAIIAHTESGSRDLLVNTIGNYTGTRPLNFVEGPTEFEITADGSWTITITSLLEQPTLAETSSGSGDEVLFVDTGSGRLTLTHDGDSNFVVLAYGSMRELLVNEIGGYEGTVRLPDALALEIQADGSWTTELG
jgi:hypothetical protein